MNGSATAYGVPRKSTLPTPVGCPGVHVSATPKGIDVTNGLNGPRVTAECCNRPVEVAKVRSPTSTTSFAGSSRTRVNVVRTLVPGDAPPAVYCEKFRSVSVCRRVMYSLGVPLMSWQYTDNMRPLATIGSSP